MLARIIHGSLYCERQLHVISGRTRSSFLDILSSMPASLLATFAPIWRTFDALATSDHEYSGLLREEAERPRTPLVAFFSILLSFHKRLLLKTARRS